MWTEAFTCFLWRASRLSPLVSFNVTWHSINETSESLFTVLFFCSTRPPESVSLWKRALSLSKCPSHIFHSPPSLCASVSVISHVSLRRPEMLKAKNGERKILTRKSVCVCECVSEWERNTKYSCDELTARNVCWINMNITDGRTNEL